MKRTKEIYFKIWIKEQLRFITKDYSHNIPLKICLNANSIIGDNKNIVILTIEDLNKKNKEIDKNIETSYIIDPITPKIYIANNQSSSNLQKLKKQFFIKNGIYKLDKSPSIEDSLKKLTIKMLKFQNLKREHQTLHESYERIQTPILNPDFYIPPYFYFKDTEEFAYKASVYCLKVAKDYLKEGKCYAMLCTTINSLEKNIDQIFEDYSISDGFISWFRYYEGERAKEDKIERKIYLDKSLAEFKTTISNFSCHNDFKNDLLSGYIIKTNSTPKGYIKSGGRVRSGPKRDCYISKSHKIGNIDQYSNSYRKNQCNCYSCNKAIKRISNNNPHYDKKQLIKNYLKVFKKDESLRIRHFRDNKIMEL